MQSTIGDIIKRHREENCLTQKELAKKLNVSPQAVSKWETNTSLPDIALVVPLAKIFGISTDALLGFSEEDEVRV